MAYVFEFLTDPNYSLLVVIFWVTIYITVVKDVLFSSSWKIRISSTFESIILFLELVWSEVTIIFEALGVFLNKSILTFYVTCFFVLYDLFCHPFNVRTLWCKMGCIVENSPKFLDSFIWRALNMNPPKDVFQPKTGCSLLFYGM